MPANSAFAFETNCRFEMSTDFEPPELVARCTAMITAAKTAIAAMGAPMASKRRFDRFAVGMHEPFVEEAARCARAPTHRRMPRDPVF